MDLKSDEDMEEMMEEFSEDIGRNLGKEDIIQRQRTSGGHVINDKAIMWCAIAISLFVSIFALFSNNGDDSFTRETASINMRLDQIERRITAQEEVLSDKGPLRMQIDSVKKSVSSLSRSGNSLDVGLKGINLKMNSLAKELEATKKELQKRANNSIPPATASHISSRQHTVQKGETLYSISRKYDIKVDQLRNSNKLKKDGDIFPGQKLNIPGKGQ